MSDNWLYDRLVDFRSWAYGQPDVGVGDFTLHGVADFLFEAYEITTIDLSDVSVLRNQRDTLNQLLHDGIGLRQNLQDGADTLRGVWTGSTADSYLPTTPTAFSIEHDTPQTTVGGMLLDGMGNFLESFQHNASVHDQWATDNQSLLTMQGEVTSILWDIVYSIGADAIIQLIPIADLAADGGEIIFLSINVTRLVRILAAFQKLNQAWRLLIIVSTIVAVQNLTTTIVDDIHTLTLPHSTAVTVPGSTTYAFDGTVTSASDLPRTQPPPLSGQEIDNIAQNIAKDFPEVGKDQIAAMLRLFGSEKVVRYFLNFAQEMGLTSRSDIAELFQKFLGWAKDKATGGTFRWAEAVVALFYIEVLYRPWTRAESTSYDFDEGDIKWDIKSFYNTSVDKMVDAIREGIDDDEHIVIDKTNLSAQEVQTLEQQIQANGWGDLIEWFPPW